MLRQGKSFGLLDPLCETRIIAISERICCRPRRGTDATCKVVLSIWDTQQFNLSFDNFDDQRPFAVAYRRYTGGECLRWNRGDAHLIRHQPENSPDFVKTASRDSLQTQIAGVWIEIS